MWSSAVHSRRTRPVLRSTSWKMLLLTSPPRGPPSGDRSHWIGLNAVSSAVFCEVRWKSCRSACQAVAGMHAAYLLVGGVVDHLFAHAEALRRYVALPPGQHRFAAEFLELQVGGLGLAVAERVEPDEVAGFVEDHRPRLPGGVVGRGEDVAGRALRGVRADDDRGGFELGRRVEVHLLARVPDFVFGARVGQHVFARDRELEVERLCVRAACDGAPDDDGLARVERARRDEARAVPLGVGAQLARVPTACGPAHRDLAQLRGGHADEADLRRGQRVIGTGHRVDRHVGGREDRRAVEDRRGAAAVGGRSEGGVLGRDAAQGEGEGDGAREQHEQRSGHQEPAVASGVEGSHWS